jgi:hypothetical protein
VELITSGKPVPGIRDIPPTVLADQATKPTASRRRKPWEKEDNAQADESTFGEGALEHKPIVQPLNSDS